MQVEDGFQLRVGGLYAGSQQEFRGGFLSQPGLNVVDSGPPVSSSQDESMGSQSQPQSQNQIPFSQEPFCTPDFITPVDQQFGTGYDPDKENCCDLSVDRYKRQRPDSEEDDTPCTKMCTGMHNTHLTSPLISSSNSLAVRGNLLGTPLTSARPPSGSSQDNKVQTSFLNYIPPNSSLGRGKFKAPSPKVSGPSGGGCPGSPLCHTNPFLDEGPHARPSRRRNGLSLAGAQAQGPASRYSTDFQELEQVGRGSYGRVHKVVSRLDGCLYAIKKSSKPIRSGADQSRKLQEVQALAAVGRHPHIVAYFGAWLEQDALHIQLEMCSSSLAARQKVRAKFEEGEIREVLAQVGAALAHMHTRGVVHLDIKPDNILVQDGMYKLGDFGHANLLDPSKGGIVVEEGDGRYVSHELLNGNHSALDRADIFALGAVAYELARGVPLPQNGKQHEDLRKGRLALMPDFSSQFQNLLKAMLHEDAAMRPTADVLINHPMFKCS